MDIEASDLPSIPRPVDEQSDLRAIGAYEQRLRDQTEKLSRTLVLADNRAETNALFQSLLDALPHERPHHAEPDDESQKPAVHLSGPFSGEAVTRVKQRLKALEDRVPIDASLDVHSRVRGFIAAVVAAPTSNEAERAFAALNVEVEQANERKRSATRDHDEVLRLQRSLDGLRGDDVARLQGVLERVSAGEGVLTAALAGRVASVRESATQRADRAYVRAVFVHALEKLGYGVQADFETLDTDPGVSLYERPGRQGYMVRVGATEMDSVTDIAVVRIAGADERPAHEQSALDRIAEEEFCADYERLVSDASESGVAARTVRHLRPGERPMAVIRHPRATDRSAAKDELKVRAVKEFD